MKIKRLADLEILLSHKIIAVKFMAGRYLVKPRGAVVIVVDAENAEPTVYNQYAMKLFLKGGIKIAAFTYQMVNGGGYKLYAGDILIYQSPTDVGAYELCERLDALRYKYLEGEYED